MLIQDDKITPRHNWRREKVEELIVSRDSKIRGAVLRVYNKRKTLRFYWRDPYKNWFHLKLWTVLMRAIKMFRVLLLIVHNEKQVMAGECRILVVQGSSTWLSEYNLNSLGFLFSSKLIIMKESYVSIVFLIISGYSLRRKLSKF